MAVELPKHSSRPSTAGSLLVVRARLRRHWRSTIAVAVLVGLAGGVVVASLAGARRVETAYDRLLTDIDAYDLVAATCDETASRCRTQEVRQQLSESGLVESMATGVAFQLPVLTTTDGRPMATPGTDNPCATGDHERAIWTGPGGWGPGGRLPMRVEEGRTFDPDAMEILVPRIVADRVGLAPGDTLLLVGPCRDDEPAPWPEPLRLTVAGVGVGPLDIDTPTVEGTSEILLGAPAVMDAMDHRGWPQGSRSEGVAIWTVPGTPDDDVITVVADVTVGGALFVIAERTAQIGADLKPDATTLRLLALLVAVASALVLTPLLARQVRVTSSGEAVLSALGATRRRRTGYGLAYAAVVGALGAIVAIGVGFAVSRWVPRGLAESIEADPGWSVDPIVVAIGLPSVTFATVLLAAGPAWLAARSSAQTKSPGIVARMAAAQRLGPSAGTGLRAALGGPGAGERTVPVRSGTVALAVALACVAGAQTFAAGLSELRATPRLVGWGWDAMVYLDQQGDRLEELEGTPGVERVTAGTLWTLAGEATLATGADVTTVIPRAFAAGPGAITPVVTDGRAAEGADELVVPQTVADTMGLEVGDAVELAVPDPARALASMSGIDVGADEWQPRASRYEVVGIGTLVRFGVPVPPVALTLDGLARLVAPTVDELSALAGQLGLDAGSLLDRVDVEMAARPQVAYVDVEGGRDRASDVLATAPVAEVIAPSNGESVINSLELIDLSRASRVPDVLGALFAVVSIGVLIVLVAGGVRGRRRELAVLRALGLSNRQVRASVAWQASLQVIVPVAIGVPLGVIVGQRVWRGYAESISVVPATAIGWPYLLTLVAAALVLANAVALLLAPGTVRHPSRSLRSE